MGKAYKIDGGDANNNERREDAGGLNLQHVLTWLFLVDGETDPRKGHGNPAPEKGENRARLIVLPKC